MFDHGPVKEDPIRTPSEALKKQRASLMMRLAVHSMSGGGPLPEPSKTKIILKPIRVDEERFGKASPVIAQPLLAGNRGKLSRKKRKAAKAKLDPVSTPQYNEYIAQHCN